MAKVKVKQSSPFKNIFIIAISVVILYLGFIAIKPFVNSSSSDSNSQNKKYEEVLSKGGYNKLSYEDWKIIAIHDAQKYYDGLQNSTLADTYNTQAFSISYNNDWVTFRNALDDYANLNSDQVESLKEFYQKTRDEISERVKKKLEDNDKKLRPNKYE
jgi:hypothetical protein